MSNTPAASVEDLFDEASGHVALGELPEAIALYRRCGFVVSHGYHYRSEGIDPEQGC